MILKLVPCCDLVDYVTGAVTWCGEPREEDPMLLRGAPATLMELVETIAGPGADLGRKKARQQLFRREVTHSMACFSEARGSVEPCFPQIIRAIELSVAAGLPPEDVYVLCYEHPQETGAHLHFGIPKRLLPLGRFSPFGGPVGWKLRRGLERAINARFELSDRDDPRRFRLVRPSKASFKPSLKPYVQPVIEATRLAWKERRLCSCADFHRILAAHHFKIVACPGLDYRRHEIVPTASGLLSPRRTRLVEALAENGRGPLVCFEGPVCRPDFSPALINRELERLRKSHEQLRQRPQEVFDAFLEWLRLHMEWQRARHPHRRGKRIGAEDFEFLRPDSWPLAPPRVQAVEPEIGS